MWPKASGRGPAGRLIGARVFGQRIRPGGWAGMGLVIAGVVALKLL